MDESEGDLKEFCRPLQKKNEMLRELAERYCKTHFYGGDNGEMFVEDMIEGGPLVLVGTILCSEGPLSIDDFFSAFGLGSPKTREEISLRSELNSMLKIFKFDENYKLHITQRQIEFLTEYYPQFRYKI